MRFHVLGLGPIGSLLSHHLRRVIPPQYEITLIHKSSRQAKQDIRDPDITVERNGILTHATGFRSEVFEIPYQSVLASFNARRTNDPADATTNDSPPPPPHFASTLAPLPPTTAPPIDSLFVTTKAHQTLSAIRRILPRITPNTTIVLLLQNGTSIPVYEQLIHTIFRNPVLRPHFIIATASHGVWFKQNQTLVHSTMGNIQFGIVPDPHPLEGRDFEPDVTPTTPTSLSLDAILSNTSDPHFTRYHSLRNTVAALQRLHDLDATWKPYTHVQSIMRRKLAVSSVIHPLTAIMGCRNGAVFTTNAAHQIRRTICEEAAGVFEAQAVAEARLLLESSPTSPSPHTSPSSSPHTTTTSSLPPLSRILTPEALSEECLRVVSHTKEAISSMLFDVRRGRRTEIEYLNGYLCALGALYRVQVPGNRMLMGLVKMRSAIALD